ncbi:MAG: alkaline phosphatase [Rikenellaceae bacterium]|nr:alkaline phosphatase [Rikenellaceae bacterium]
MRRLLLTLSACIAGSMSWAAGPKYVFYFIGDGMGIPLINAAQYYSARTSSDYTGATLYGYGNHKLTMSALPISGIASTDCADSHITDSAAAGTALASGSKTNTGMIGMAPDGDKLYSIAHTAKEAGKAVGIITTVSIDHATPASFYAHRPNRGLYHEIALDGIEAGFDLYGGSGFLKPVKDSVDIYNLYDKAGYVRMRGRDGLKKMKNAKSPVLLTEREEAPSNLLAMAIDRSDDDMTLAEMVSASIDYLSNRGGEEGFFLMAEGGQIDMVCHSNDPKAAIEETLDFDKAIAVAYDFYKRHPHETLIIVTADHETGGFALGNYANGYTLPIDRLRDVKGSASMLTKLVRESDMSWSDARTALEEMWRLGDDIKVSDDEWAELEKIYAESKSRAIYEASMLVSKAAGLGWTTGSHTAAPVAIFAVGHGLEPLAGMHDNTDIANLLRKLYLQESIIPHEIPVNKKVRR